MVLTFTFSASAGRFLEQEEFEQWFGTFHFGYHGLVGRNGQQLPNPTRSETNTVYALPYEKRVGFVCVVFVGVQKSGGGGLDTTEVMCMPGPNVIVILGRGLGKLKTLLSQVLSQQNTCVFDCLLLIHWSQTDVFFVFFIITIILIFILFFFLLLLLNIND